MQVTPKCERCVFYAHDPHLVCVHPLRVSGESCIDFQENPELIGKRFVDFLGLNSSDETDNWQPEGARYINEELVIERSLTKCKGS